MAEYVVAYGNLRRGLQYHQQYHGESVYHSTETIHGLKMYYNPEQDYPFVVRSEGSIVGEIYSVSQQQLQYIDAFTTLDNEFVREKITIGELNAWVYVYARERNPTAVEVPNGDWAAHQSHI